MSMQTTFTIGTMVDMNRAIDHYMTELLMRMSQPNPRTADDKYLVEWTKNKSHEKPGWWWDTGYNLFLDFDVHLIKEGWGSTSAGWGGIGGAAMTETYTTVIHCRNLNIIAVYYDGQLAYVREVDPMNPDFTKPKAYSSVKHKTDNLYLNPRYK